MKTYKFPFPVDVFLEFKKECILEKGNNMFEWCVCRRLDLKIYFYQIMVNGFYLR